jgi:hypothetical protein
VQNTQPGILQRDPLIWTAINNHVYYKSTPGLDRSRSEIEKYIYYGPIVYRKDPNLDRDPNRGAFRIYPAPAPAPAGRSRAEQSS